MRLISTARVAQQEQQPSEGRPWSCRFKLRKEFDDERNERLLEVSEVEFGAPVSDPSLVEERLRRAQKALLNPSSPLAHFLTCDLSQDPKEEAASNRLKFTQNLVVLEVHGAPVDLTLIDL